MITAALAALGISTKVAAAATASAIAVGGLGVAGAAIVDRAPEEVPVVDGADAAPESVRQDADHRQDAGAPVGPTEETAEAAVEPVREGDIEGEGPPEGSFGARVSTDAKDGGVDGLEIAAEAQANAAARAEAPPGPPADLPTLPALPAPLSRLSRLPPTACRPPRPIRPPTRDRADLSAEVPTISNSTGGPHGASCPISAGWPARTASSVAARCGSGPSRTRRT